MFLTTVPRPHDHVSLHHTDESRTEERVLHRDRIRWRRIAPAPPPIGNPAPIGELPSQLARLASRTSRGKSLHLVF